MKKQLQAKNLKRMKIKETEFLRQMNEQLQNEIERKMQNYSHKPHLLYRKTN